MDEYQYNIIVDVFKNSKSNTPDRKLNAGVINISEPLQYNDDVQVYLFNSTKNVYFGKVYQRIANPISGVSSLPTKRITIHTKLINPSIKGLEGAIKEFVEQGTQPLA